MPEREYQLQEPEGLLAHYTSAAVAFEHILPSGELRMSPYRRMRDPAENKDIVPGTAWSGDPANPEQAWVGMIEEIKAVRDSMRLLSFTRDAPPGEDREPVFRCCWARPRLWEQYGDRHRGACLLFHRGILEQTLEQDLEETPYLGDVRYTREGIAGSATRNLLDDRIFDRKQRADAVNEYIERNSDDFFFLKSDDFETEYEYRIVLRTGDEDVGYRSDEEGYAYVSYGEALVAVVGGEDFPDWQLPGARAACAQQGAQLRRMHWWQGRPYALDKSS
jgi:hypothetical protein